MVLKQSSVQRKSLLIFVRLKALDNHLFLVFRRSAFLRLRLPFDRSQVFFSFDFLRYLDFSDFGVVETRIAELLQNSVHEVFGRSEKSFSVIFTENLCDAGVPVALDFLGSFEFFFRQFFQRISAVLLVLNFLGPCAFDFFCRAEDFFGPALCLCASACRREERIVGVHRRDIRAVVHKSFNRRHQSRKRRMREPHGACRHCRTLGHDGEKR